MGQNVYVVNGAFLLRYIPAVFIMIGLWLAFFNTTNKKEINSTTGFTLIRVIEILKFIINCILLIGSIALAVVYVVAAGAAAETMSLIVGVIMLLVVILLSVFIIMFFLQLIFSIKVVRENVRTGFDRRKIPGFLIFIGFVGCLVNVAAMLPMAAKRLKLDPAIMAAPLITTIVDTCSTLMFFALACVVFNIQM